MAYMFTAAVSLMVVAVVKTAAAEPLPPDFTAGLESEKQVYIATQRADGTRSGAVPIWFWWDGRQMYFTTGPDAYKTRRIKRGSPVFLSFESADGPFVEGHPEIIEDLEVVARMGEAYKEKYWLAWLGIARPRPQRVADGKTVAVRVTFDGGGDR